MRGFNRFDADNEPHSAHDFGMVTLAGFRCSWKIDCYDRDLRFDSPDPADPAVTTPEHMRSSTTLRPCSCGPHRTS
ncbi:DUF3768 domain-containing protein [Methylorubrum extorquens]